MPVKRSQMDALLKRLEGPLRRAFEQAIRNAQAKAQIAAITKAIEGGDLNALIAATGLRDGMWSAFTEQLRGAYVEAGNMVVGADVPKRFGAEFDLTNPRAEEYLRTSAAKFITAIKTEQRQAIQFMLYGGMAAGDNPRTIALDIVGRISRETGRRAGGIIGLSEPQAKYAWRMRADLQAIHYSGPEGDKARARYFNRKLRDKRFDSTVRKAIKAGKPVPAPMRQKIEARYSDRLLKHRGDTIARTEALRAINAANDQALQQVVDDGLAPRNAVKRIWRHSFSANEREGHRMMSGQERGMEEFFTNPVTGIALARPGDGPAGEVINCRCYIEHKIDFVEVEKQGQAQAPIIPGSPKAPSPASTAARVATAPQKPQLKPNLSLGDTATDTTDEIISGLRQALPQEAQKRLDMLEDIIRYDGSGTVFTDNLNRTVSTAQRTEMWDYANMKLGKTVPAYARSATYTEGAETAVGLASKHWPFVIVQARGSLVNNIVGRVKEMRKIIARSIRDNAKTIASTGRASLRSPHTLSGGDPLGVWIHEFGHKMHFRAGGRSRFNNLHGAAIGEGNPEWFTLSTYGDTDDYEFVAEHFVAWLLDREALAQARAPVAELIDDIMEAALKAAKGGT